MNPATADLFRDEIARLQAEIKLLDAAHKASNSAMLVIESGFKNALAEIARLRSQPCPYVTGNVTHYCTLTPLTLTDAEREAINVAQNLMAGTAHAKAFGSLLERTGGGE